MDKPTFEELERLGFVREWYGRFQYKFDANGSWYNDNSRDGALTMARRLYHSLPESERITPSERGKRVMDAEYAEMDAVWHAYTDEQLQDLIVKWTSGKHSIREFNGNGGRYTSAATNNAGVRDGHVHAARMRRYIERRKQEANNG